MKRLPTLTIVVFLVTAVVTSLAYAHPSVLNALQRTPTIISGREWWRLVSPVLVNPEGTAQIIWNALALIVVGTLAEQFWERQWWLVFYAAGAVSGQIAGLAWQPVGAGSSVAIYGLVGAVAIALWRHVATRPARAGPVLIIAGGILLTILHDIHGPPVLVAALIATGKVGVDHAS